VSGRHAAGVRVRGLDGARVGHRGGDGCLTV
jgi:hypothetical protein